MYCDEAQRSLYTIVITEDGRFMSCAVDHSGDGSDSTACAHASCCRSAQGTECKLEYLSTGPMGWIFCIHEYVLYAGLKKTTSPRYVTATGVDCRSDPS